MPLSANPAARSALIYITVGALMDVWAGVWYWYMRSIPVGNQDSSWWYVCTGMLLSGGVLIVIGLLTGRIGREARHADAPPAPPADALATANARAANANAAMTANLAANAPNSAAPMYVVPTATPAGVPMAGSLAPASIPVAVKVPK